MPSTRVLVIEDDILIGQDIVEHLVAIGYEAIGPVDNYSEAKKILEQTEIDLALIDIKLQGEKDGIDVAQFIRSEIDIPFIFLSSLANQTTLDRAKAARPSTYLLKPFNAKAVEISLQMALANHALYNNALTKIKDVALEDALPIKKYLFLKKESFFHRVAFSDICWIKADGNYTEFYTASKRFVQTIQLSKVEIRLPKHLFKRVHRSYIVNIEAITGFIGNTLYIREQEIPVSSGYREEVFHLFDTI